MSYVFDVSSENNDLMEVNDFVLYKGHGDYKGFNRVDEQDNTIYNVEFRDKRYALQFKLKFNATVVKWDESDDEEIITVGDLIARGYVEMKLHIDSTRSTEFESWCHDQDIAVMDEIKFISGNREPMTIYLPPHKQVLVKLTWG